MKILRYNLVLVLLVGILSGCTSNVHVEDRFPVVVADPRPFNAVLVVDREFQTFKASPNEKTNISLGESQVDLMYKAFSGLFDKVTIVSSRSEAPADTDLVIIPSVREVQLSTPTESYLNVYEVWIKYNLDIETADGVAIDSWFLPAYGKTPYSYLFSRSLAVESATVMALRDAAAKLMLDFFRIPAIYGWMQEHQAAEASP